MFDDIYPLLAGLNPAVSKDKWRLLVDYGWRSDGDRMGYVLVENGAIVGFLATLFSRRIVDGKEVTLCNTAHWVVKEEFRAESLRLLLPVLKLKDCTVTDLTSQPKLSAMMRTLGYKWLETTVRLLFPVPVLPRLAREDVPLIASDRSAVVETLDAGDRKIFSDHSGCECGHVVVWGPDGYCYLVFTKKQRRVYGRDVPYCHIHYISNRGVFLRHLGRVKLYFLRTFGSWFLAVDQRLIGQRSVAFSRVYRLPVPRYYRSDVLGADQIDNLYTELVVLGS